MWMYVRSRGHDFNAKRIRNIMAHIDERFTLLDRKALQALIDERRAAMKERAA